MLEQKRKTDAIRKDFIRQVAGIRNTDRQFSGLYDYAQEYCYDSDKKKEKRYITGRYLCSLFRKENLNMVLEREEAGSMVVYLSVEGTLVFRAIIRLTKGTFYRTNGKRQGLQFADLTQEDIREEAVNDRKEYLTLFLERPYFKGISEEKEKEVVWFAVEMLKKKAKQLQAELVLSDAYKKFALEEKQFIRAKYYMYISESKNGEQYLDSPGRNGRRKAGRKL